MENEKKEDDIEQLFISDQASVKVESSISAASMLMAHKHRTRVEPITIRCCAPLAAVIQ